MRFTNIVFAAFVAISQLAIAAPIEADALEARTNKPKVVIPVVGNDNNAIIAGSGNGGNGGGNYAAPVAVAGSKSSTWGWTHGVKVGSTAGNAVGQDASGGDGSATGTYGSGNTFSSRGHVKGVVVPVFDNDNNAIIVGSGNGGNGGTNYAAPVAIAGSKSSTKGKTGWVSVGSIATNEVGQDASGGDGSAVGSYGSNNHFARGYKPVVIPVVNNDNNAIIANSGNGGNGGKNIAVPVAFAGSSSSTKGKTGSVSVGSVAGNAVGQDASGGDGSVVGTYGEHNHFGRSYKPPVLVPLVDNDNNAIIVGSGNGGNGGVNVAVPLAVAASSSESKGHKSGSISVGTGAGNIVSQGAKGGDGSAVGTYGSGNTFKSS